MLSPMRYRATRRFILALFFSGGLFALSASADTATGNQQGAAEAEMVVLVSGLHQPFGIQVDETDLYFSEFGNGTVNRVSKHGGPVITLASGLEEPSRLVIDDDYVYFAETKGGAVSKVPKKGGAVSILAKGLQHPRTLALDDRNVYFSDYTAGVIKKVAKEGGPVTTLAEGLREPETVVIDGDEVYFIEGASEGGTVKRISKNGGRVVTLANHLPMPAGLVVDKSRAYVGAYQGPALISVPKTIGAFRFLTGEKTSVLAVGSKGPACLQLDHSGRSIFFIDGHWADRHRAIKEVSLSEGIVRTVAAGDILPQVFAFDERSVYFTDQQDGTIKRVAKH